MDGAAIDSNLILVHSEKVRGQFAQLGMNVGAGPYERSAHEYGRVARRGLQVEGDHGCVSHDDLDLVQRRAQRVGGELGEDRPGALTHVGGAGVDDHAAVGQQAHGGVRQASGGAGLDRDRDATTASGRQGE